MVIFKFWVFNILLMVTVFAAGVRIASEVDKIIAILVVAPITVFLLIKVYNYGGIWGSYPKEEKKSKKKKKKKSQPGFFWYVADTFDFLFGWAMPFILLIIVLGILISAMNQ